MKPKDVAEAAGVINSEQFMEHIRILSSDEFEGRAPGTIGEQKSVEYLEKQCTEIGLAPTSDKTGYRQTMMVYRTMAEPSASFSFACQTKADSSGSEPINLRSPEDCVLWTQKLNPLISLRDSDVVFVGYGVVAPEYNWDDYKGVDVRGKTIVMLVNDPRRPKTSDPSQLDDSFFRGSAMTYYGRWTYKFEIAAEKGAAAALIVHETGPAGYGYDVVTTSWGRDNFCLGDTEATVPVQGWLSFDTTQKLFARSGKSFEKLKEAAQLPDFRPVELGAKATIDIKNIFTSHESSNVIAKIQGRDADVGDECIVYSAHWDHFGKTVKNGVTGIYSGAIDNASGCAAILEIARAHMQLPERTRRTALFFFPTLEERGLLGAQFYVKNPVIPLEHTLAILNIDAMNVWGRTRKVVSIARGHSSLDDVLAECAKAQDRTVISDLEPEKGFFFRSDHLEFLRKGVPAIFFLGPGTDFIGKPPDFRDKKRLEYITHDYHKVTDKIKPDWDLSGAVEDAQLIFSAGVTVAEAQHYPQWLPTSEFHVPRGKLVGQI